MISSYPAVQIYILSRNRVEYLREALASALNQSYQNYEVIISDNSTNNSVWEFIQNRGENIKVKYIKRQDNLTFMDHTNVALSEVHADYFMLFHDDDILMPDAITNLMQIILKEVDLSAVGSNAYIIKNRVHTNEIFNPHLNVDKRIFSCDDLVRYYFTPEESHVPFPSYLYRKNKIKDIFLSSKEGGKHADVSFLIKLIQRGPIYWISKPFMEYRQHTANISLSIDIRDIFSLCRYVKKNTQVSKDTLRTFKMKHLLLWSTHTMRNHPAKNRWRETIIKRSAFVYAISHPQLIIKSLSKKKSSQQFVRWQHRTRRPEIIYYVK
ncbi:MAG: glycosyltransferase family 2 protein [Bdellovibrionaceae bacterium]|nr:glycosyltransferase family 2 protein [Pseudobdellovibrionaceae bacterium]